MTKRTSRSAIITVFGLLLLVTVWHLASPPVTSDHSSSRQKDAHESETGLDGTHHHNHDAGADSQHFGKSSSHDHNSTCMTMSMTGFQWWSRDDTSQFCFLVASFVILSRWQLYLAVIMAFAMGLTLEYLTVRLRQQQRNQQCRRLFLAVYMLQALQGYLVMIVTMSYSYELLGGVFLGLAVGHAMLGRD